MNNEREKIIDRLKRLTPDQLGQVMKFLDQLQDRPENQTTEQAPAQKEPGRA